MTESQLFRTVIMSPRLRVDRAAKRAGVATVAATVFTERGVARTAVSDIVRAAGIAQGTFYLYFESKDDLVLAVAARFVSEVGIALEASIPGPEVSAPTRFRGLVAALGGMASSPSNLSMAEFLHRPENRALHDRITEPLAERMYVMVESIVAQGVSEGSMVVADAGAAAWFVLGGLQSVERAGTQIADVPEALDKALVLALQALGVRGTP
jgi:AcrR family transcriptional regulator